MLAERERGLSLPAAIEQVRAAPAAAEQSLFATLRRARPELVPYVLPKRSLIALSHAIEDELCARAGTPVLFAAFQRVRFYRTAVRRWGELARTAELAVAFGGLQAGAHSVSTRSASCRWPATRRCGASGRSSARATS